MKYRYTVTHEGIIEADTADEATARALIQCDGGFQLTTSVQVEPSEREGGEHERN